MKTNLSVLEIKILLKCHKKTLSRTYVTSFYFRYPPPEREKALNNLIKNNLIIAKHLPKSGAARVPVFYEITDKGRGWVKDYLDNYPKG